MERTISYNYNDSPTLMRVYINKQNPVSVMMNCNPLDTLIASDESFHDLGPLYSSDLRYALLFELHIEAWGGLARWADLNAGMYMERDPTVESNGFVNHGKSFSDKDAQHKDVTIGCYALRNAESATVSNLYSNKERMNALGILGQKYNVVVGDKYAFNVIRTSRSLDFMPDSWMPYRY